MATFSTDIAASNSVESPCIRLCTLDYDDICVGCFRSMAEICAWGSATDDERQQILLETEVRKEATTRHAKIRHD